MRPADGVITGSSPRGRGTQLVAEQSLPVPRFIPARAGNTTRSLSPLPTPAVHPRAGGEHIGKAWRTVRDFGSSPRGRGTPSGTGRGKGTRRFIPARAGNTCYAAFSMSSATVHPRAGGEHTERRTHCSPSAGSSPRGRGTLVAGDNLVVRRRFIPARAGNTSSSTNSASTAPVHPRAGGEHRGGKKP